MKWILYFVRRRQMAREDKQELQSHIDEKVDDLVEAGMSEQAARRQARREFGNPTLFAEIIQEGWGWASLERLGQDLRHGWRQMARNPGFTAVAVLSLALGIAANTTIFSVINAFEFRPLPYRDAERLMILFETVNRGQGPRLQEPPVATVSDWRKQNSVFEDVALVDPYSGAGTLTGIGPAERVRTQGVGPNLFPILGVAPILGRGFDLEEHRRGNRQYLISYAFWKRRFDGSPQVLGTRITMEGIPGTIVGVMPRSFPVYYARDVDVWGTLDPESARYAKRKDHYQHAIARLKPNISGQQAQADMDAIAARLAIAYPETNRDTGVKVVSLGEQLSRRGNFMHLPMQAVGFVLLIACANVANLLMARMASRQKEMTLRASLGAGRVRLIRQLLTEALLLATVGAVVGLLLTRVGIRLFRILLPGTLQGLEVTSADPRVLLFTLAISMLTGILFGLAPAIATSRVRLNDTLKTAAARRNLTSTSGMLVITEMALAMLLLVGAGLTMNSFLRLQGVNPGFDAGNVSTMEVFLRGPHYVTPGPNLLQNVSPEATRFYQELLSRIERLPGVESVGMIGQLPTRYIEERTFTISGQPAQAEGQRPVTGYQQVSPGLFRTLRIPLKRGRLLNESDSEAGPWAVIINEALARRYFSNEEPLGKYVRLRMEPYQLEEDRPRQIVGVIGDVWHPGIDKVAPAVMYASYLQQPRTYAGGRASGHLRQNLVVRTTPGVQGGFSADSVRKIVAEMDKDQPVYLVMSMEQALAESISGWRFYVQLFGIFAAIAIGMAAIGIYGVISYAVSERTREIGIHMALGAQKRDVLRMIVRKGLLLTFAGIVVGAMLAAGLTRVITRLLFGITPTDPVTFISVAFVLAAVALGACYVPARRAAQLDPMKALHYE